MRKICILPLFAGLMLAIASCKKFVQVNPPATLAISTQVFDNQATAINTILSIYGNFMYNSSSINASLLLGQSADEFIGYTTGASNDYYTNTLSATANDDFWTSYYQAVYQANAVIDGVNGSAALTPSVKQQLIGEATFLRAFFQFYLVNLFGDIPYINTTNFNTATTAPRTPVVQVYPQIIADLKVAKGLLTDNFPDANDQPGNERVRPNKGAARAMLARAYLYTGDWKDAVLEADSVIANTANYTLLSDLTQVFLMNSQEAIWQMMPSNANYTNGYAGVTYILDQAPSAVHPVSISSGLYNAFEPGDKRKAQWIGTYQTWYYPYKYRASQNFAPVSEYEMVIRLAEVYLIRAEASAHLDDLGTATADLNTIRARAGLAATTATTQTDLLTAIMHERQVELFTEWGHRWLDLKRTGQADAVMGPIKGSNWQTTDQLFPIPQTQINLDPAMTGAQNPGY